MVLQKTVAEGMINQSASFTTVALLRATPSSGHAADGHQPAIADTAAA